MPNPLFQMYGGAPNGAPSFNAPMNPMQRMQMYGGAPSFNAPMNPMQRMQMFMQAMMNPAAYIRNQFPDIPVEIQNNPGQILSYLQKTRGISNQQVQQAQNDMQQAQNDMQQIVGSGSVR